MIQRRKPLPRRRAKPRRIRSPRCVVRGCDRLRVVVCPSCERGDRDWEHGYCLTHAKQEADRRFSLAVRSIGRCEGCGQTEGLQCSHFISRRYLGVRWTRLNAECLCRGCHKFLTERPLEARDRARERLSAAVYDELEEQARRFVGPVDYAAVLAKYPPVAKEVA